MSVRALINIHHNRLQELMMTMTIKNSKLEILYGAQTSLTSFPYRPTGTTVTVNYVPNDDLYTIYIQAPYSQTYIVTRTNIAMEYPTISSR